VRGGGGTCRNERRHGKREWKGAEIKEIKIN
jgi:hypothetical protein